MPGDMFVDTCLLNSFLQMFPTDGIMWEREYFFRHYFWIARKTDYLHQVIAQGHHHRTMCAPALALDLIEAERPGAEIDIGVCQSGYIAESDTRIQ